MWTSLHLCVRVCVLCVCVCVCRYTPNFGRWQYDPQAALSHATNTGNGYPLETFEEQVLAVQSLIEEGKVCVCVV